MKDYDILKVHDEIDCSLLRVIQKWAKDKLVVIIKQLYMGHGNLMIQYTVITLYRKRERRVYWGSIIILIILLFGCPQLERLFHRALPFEIFHGRFFQGRHHQILFY